MTSNDAGLVFEKPVNSVMGFAEEKPHDEQFEAVEDGKRPNDIFEHVEERVWDPKMKRRTMLKLDLVLMPIIVMLYLFSSLDKSNLGNAKTLGMVKDLGGDPTGQTYALLNALYFVGYAPFMVPLGLLGKRTRMAKMIAGMGIFWGIAATCFAAVNNFPGAYACRFFVGLGEAGFAPMIPIYLSRFYVRRDIAQRVSFWLAAAPMGGFVNGIIAYGVAFIKSHLENWRVLFLIEGLATVFTGVLTIIILPEDITSARYFTAEEKEFLLWRRRHEMSSETNKINWKHAIPALYRWQTLLPALMNMALQLCVASLGAFLPTFLSEQGYKGATAQIATLAPYGTSVVVMLAAAWLSDKYHNRGVPMAVGMILQGLGFLLYLVAKPGSKGLHMGALILAEVGHYICTPLVLVWAAVNCGSESRRVVAVPFLVTLAQSIAVTSGYLFPTPEGPRYFKGLGVCLGFSVVGLFAIGAYVFLLRRENLRRDRVEGKPPADVQPDTITYADEAPGFRYQL